MHIDIYNKFINITSQIHNLVLKIIYIGMKKLYKIFNKKDEHEECPSSLIID